MLPLYVTTLGMTAFNIGMLLATFSLLFILIQIPGGYVADKIGRLRPAIIGLSLAFISVVILPLVETFSSMVMIMALYGIGYGFLFPSVSAMVADFTMSDEYGRATGIFHALITVGVSVGAPVIGWVASFWGTKVGLSLSGSALFIALVMATMKTRQTNVR